MGSVDAQSGWVFCLKVGPLAVVSMVPEQQRERVVVVEGEHGHSMAVRCFVFELE